MRHRIGFDVGKRFHWLCVLDEEGDVLLSRRVAAAEERLEAACSEIAALGEAEERVIGIDMVGGPATLLEAILPERGERVRYTSAGTAVNKVRDAYSGGEHKSDPKDAFVIADQLRLRWRSLREVHVREEDTLELRTPVRATVVGIWSRISAGAYLLLESCFLRYSPGSKPRCRILPRRRVLC